MRTSRRIAAAMTAALVSMSALAGTASAAPAKSPSAPAGDWCWPVAGQYYEVGPVIMTSSANTTSRNICGKGTGTWWRGINGSPDVLQLSSVPLANNLFFQIHVQGEFAEQIGGIQKPVCRWDNSRF